MSFINRIISRGGGVKLLLDRCYPQPPRDVYDRMLWYYKPGDPFYTLEHDQHTVGMVYCSRHSKGGHLENLAVDPECRGQGLGRLLVEALIKDNPGIISLTTRIPEYFEQFGFTGKQTLEDGSNFMFLNRCKEQGSRCKVQGPRGEG